jgi:putative oxygen-independent coproporphyrinogen III oxidase
MPNLSQSFPTTKHIYGDAPADLSVPPPLCVYVHIPWCLRKCPYCDFNSHPASGDVPEGAYLDALEADLARSLPRVWGRRVDSVFIGGGTPSLFSAAGIDRLLTAVRTLLPVHPSAEITLEANPGTFEAERFRGYRSAGVNRLSLGIQSFNPLHLQALGRIHDDREAHGAVEAALATFDNVNLDLMYALPGQSLDEARNDVETAVCYRTAHLSAYHLTLEPNTAFAAAPPPLPDDDLAADMQAMVEETLAGAGYEHYETSAHAASGRRCRHNLNYWQFGDYLGVGAGAHSKLSSAEAVQREARLRHPRQYLAALIQRREGSADDHIAERRVLGPSDRVFEFMMNALRLTEGFPEGLFHARTGLPMAAAAEGLREARARGLLEDVPGGVRPTPRGRRFLNDLLELFLP